MKQLNLQHISSGRFELDFGIWETILALCLLRGSNPSGCKLLAYPELC